MPLKDELMELAELPDPHVLMDDDPVLRAVSEPVTDFDYARNVAIVMERVLDKRLGRGLAAIQIGTPLRILIIRENGERDKEIVMVNPTLDRTLNRFTTEREGCLSIPPRKWGDVSRPAKCDATWFSLDGQRSSATLTNDTARIFQHEFDHLNGVLMTDHMRTRASIKGSSHVRG